MHEVSIAYLVLDFALDLADFAADLATLAALVADLAAAATFTADLPVDLLVDLGLDLALDLALDLPEDLTAAWVIEGTVAKGAASRANSVFVGAERACEVCIFFSQVSNHASYEVQAHTSSLAGSLSIIRSCGRSRSTFSDSLAGIIVAVVVTAPSTTTAGATFSF